MQSTRFVLYNVNTKQSGLGCVHGGLNDDYYFSRKMIYGDIFYNLANIQYDYDTVMNEVNTAKNKAYEYMQEHDRHYDYYQLVYQIAKLRAEQINDYLEGRLPTIVELDEIIIEDEYKVWHNKAMTPSIIPL